MRSQKRLTRRLLGAIHARLPEVGLENIHDPRRKHGKRWSLGAILNGIMIGLISGCRSLAETEELTEVLPRAVASWLGLGRRLPDTTMRDVLVKLQPRDIREALHRQVKATHRRKLLKPVGFPSGIVSIDGKYTSIPNHDPLYAQKQSGKAGKSDYGMVRTLTCSLINASSTICLDAVPIPAKTNEMGHFKEAVRELEEVYGHLDLYETIMGDAGMCSLANATYIHELNRGYIFRVKQTQPTILTEMERLLSHLPASQASHRSLDIIPGKTQVTRRLWITYEMNAWLDWPHIRGALRLEITTETLNGSVSIDNRYYVTNLPKQRLTPTQWVAAFRQHWRIENHCHWVFDVIFHEDDRPWLNDPKGMLNLLLLRRIAYNLVLLFRSKIQRTSLKFYANWRRLLDRFKVAFLQAGHDLALDFRTRRAPVPIA